MIAFALSDLLARDSALQLLPPAPAAAAALEISSVCTDSRRVQPGDFFIALRGERFDGHDYLQQAREQGAAVLGVSVDFVHKEPQLCRSLQDSGALLLAAPDTLRLYGLCALCVRAQFHGRVGALTGSCGKTTVKEMTAAVLGQCGSVLYTEGNFNNDVGVPLTLLRLRQDHDFAVIEQGASHRGDIARTCEFVQADAALINNVGRAHIEGFGSQDGVYQGKSEILEDVCRRGGTGLVPADSSYFARWCSDFASMRAQGRLLSFGSGADNFVRFSDVEERPGGISFVLQHEGQSASLSLDLPGRHNAGNAAAAAALALSLGADFQQVCAGLKLCRSMQGRLRLIRLGALTLIDDAYNAGFDAVCAGLDVLSAFRDSFRVMVFGDMGELGTQAADLHRQVGEYARGRADAFAAIGQWSKLSCEAWGSGAQHFAAHEALNAALGEQLASRLAAGQACTVLVKGSHGMQMHLIVDYLSKRFQL